MSFVNHNSISVTQKKYLLQNVTNVEVGFKLVISIQT